MIKTTPTSLQPHRIAAVPNIVLDVIVDNSAVNKRISSSHDRQLQLEYLTLSSDGDDNDDDDESTQNEKISSRNVTPTSSATSTHSASSTAASAVRRNPVYGLEEAAMDNYSHIPKPPLFPYARGPQAVLNDQPPTIQDLPFLPLADGDTESQLRGPQHDDRHTNGEGLGPDNHQRKSRRQRRSSRPW